MANNHVLYTISDLEVHSVVHNKPLLDQFTMAEFHDLYKKYFGSYEMYYPYILAAKIKVYDESPAVNSFLFKGKELWLDKATRVGLMHLANCSTSDLQLVLDGEVLTIPVETAKEFLARLEVYAGQCYLQTQKHLQAIKELKTIEDFITYDYTTGYPEKITLA